jgi:hypothetical protein
MAEPDKADLDDTQIVQFFDQLHEQLWGMPWSESSRINRELQLHMEEIVEARLAAGLDKDEAVSYALRQLGNPSDLGKKLRREWYLTERCRVGVTVWAITEACFWLLLIYVFVGLIMWSDHFIVTNHNRDIMLAAPILTGVALGVRHAREAVASVVHMTGIVYVLFVGLCIREAISSGTHGPVAFNWYDAAFSSVSSFVTYALFAAIPAYFVSAWKRGGLYRISPDDFRLRGRTASR